MLAVLRAKSVTFWLWYVNIDVQVDVDIHIRDKDVAFLSLLDWLTDMLWNLFWFYFFDHRLVKVIMNVVIRLTTKDVAHGSWADRLSLLG